jgi:O-antigen/teichoic acid export membrane protein
MRISKIKIMEHLRADLRPDTERGRLVRSAVMTSGIRVGSTLLAFGASLLYARTLGPHDYGLYAYVIAWATLLTIPTGLGLPSYLIREGAKTTQNLHWLGHWADKRIALTGIATAVLMALAFFIPSAANARLLFVIAAPLPLLNNLGYVRGALLQAKGWVARSQWPVLIAGPTFMLAILVAVWLWWGTLLPAEVVAATTLSAIFSLCINQFQISRTVSPSKPEKAISARTFAALPFMWLGMLNLINSRADLIMLGSLKGAQAAGIYAVVSRAAELIGFFMLSAGMVIAPRIAALYKENNHALLQRLLTATSRRVFALSMPPALLLIISAHPLLRYLYGSGYEKGALALQILSIAQLAAITSGPKGIALNMTGHERLSMLSVTLSITVNIALNAVLIPIFGIDGTAIATGTSIVAYNCVLWYQVRTHLGIRADIAVL